MTIEALIARFGLSGVAVGAALEGETAAVIGGLLAHRGILPFWSIVVSAGVGSFVMDQVFFLIGRLSRDRPTVRAVARRPAFSRALNAIDHYPVAFLFGFRFLYGLRTVSPIAIGTSSLDARLFIVANAVAAALWSLVFVTLGYTSGQLLEAAFGRLRFDTHLLLLIGALFLLPLLWLVLRKRITVGMGRDEPGQA